VEGGFYALRRAAGSLLASSAAPTRRAWFDRLAV